MRQDDERWSPRRTLLFVVAASLLLWLALYLLISLPFWLAL